MQHGNKTKTTQREEMARGKAHYPGPLGKESASILLLGSPSKGPPVSGAKLGPLDDTMSGSSHITGSLIPVGLFCPVWRSFFLAGIGILFL